MGIIDSLSFGYRFVSRRPELLLLPLLLDALLWAMPRWSIRPLLQRLADFYTELVANTPGLDGDFLTLSEQTNALLMAVGQTTNLAQFLVSRVLYRVPSLLAALPSVKGEHPSIEIDSLGSASLLSVFFILMGLLMGVTYMNLLAHRLPFGEGEKAVSFNDFAGRILLHWLRTIGFLLIFALILLLLYIPGIVVISVLTLISPPLGFGAMFLFGGVIVVIFFYLYFVTSALVLDDLVISSAVRRSTYIVWHNFWNTAGFVLLTMLISTGMELLFRQIVQLHTFGVAFATLGNTFIGTGLAISLLVFYRTRIMIMSPKQIRDSASTDWRNLWLKR